MWMAADARGADAREGADVRGPKVLYIEGVYMSGRADVQGANVQGGKSPICGEGTCPAGRRRQRDAGCL